MRKFFTLKLLNSVTLKPLSASIRKYGDVWDPKKCLAMLTQH